MRPKVLTSVADPDHCDAIRIWIQPFTVMRIRIRNLLFTFDPTFQFDADPGPAPFLRICNHCLFLLLTDRSGREKS